MIPSSFGKRLSLTELYDGATSGLDRKRQFAVVKGQRPNGSQFGSQSERDRHPAVAELHPPRLGRGGGAAVHRQLADRSRALSLAHAFARRQAGKGIERAF